MKRNKQNFQLDEYFFRMQRNIHIILKYQTFSLFFQFSWNDRLIPHLCVLKMLRGHCNKDKERAKIHPITAVEKTP